MAEGFFRLAQVLGRVSLSKEDRKVEQQLREARRSWDNHLREKSKELPQEEYRRYADDYINGRIDGFIGTFGWVGKRRYAPKMEELRYSYLTDIDKSGGAPDGDAVNTLVRMFEDGEFPISSLMEFTRKQRNVSDETNRLVVQALGRRRKMRDALVTSSSQEEFENKLSKIEPLITADAGLESLVDADNQDFIDESVFLMAKTFPSAATPPEIREASQLFLGDGDLGKFMSTVSQVMPEATPLLKEYRQKRKINRQQMEFTNALIDAEMSFGESLGELEEEEADIDRFEEVAKGEMDKVLGDLGDQGGGAISGFRQQTLQRAKLRMWNEIEQRVGRLEGVAHTKAVGVLEEKFLNAIKGDPENVQNLTADFQSSLEGISGLPAAVQDVFMQRFSLKAGEIYSFHSGRKSALTPLAISTSGVSTGSVGDLNPRASGLMKALYTGGTMKPFGFNVWKERGEGWVEDSFPKGSESEQANQTYEWLEQRYNLGGRNLDNDLQDVNGIPRVYEWLQANLPEKMPWSLEEFRQGLVYSESKVNPGARPGDAFFVPTAFNEGLRRGEIEANQLSDQKASKHRTELAEATSTARLRAKRGLDYRTDDMGQEIPILRFLTPEENASLAFIEAEAVRKINSQRKITNILNGNGSGVIYTKEEREMLEDVTASLYTEGLASPRTEAGDENFNRAVYGLAAATSRTKTFPVWAAGEAKKMLRSEGNFDRGVALIGGVWDIEAARSEFSEDDSLRFVLAEKALQVGRRDLYIESLRRIRELSASQKEGKSIYEGEAFETVFKAIYDESSPHMLTSADPERIQEAGQRIGLKMDSWWGSEPEMQEVREFGHDLLHTTMLFYLGGNEAYYDVEGAVRAAERALSSVWGLQPVGMEGEDDWTRSTRYSMPKVPRLAAYAKARERNGQEPWGFAREQALNFMVERGISYPEETKWRLVGDQATKRDIERMDGPVSYVVEIDQGYGFFAMPERVEIVGDGNVAGGAAEDASGEMVKGLVESFKKNNPDFPLTGYGPGDIMRNKEAFRMFVQTNDYEVDGLEKARALNYIEGLPDAP